MNNDKKTTSNEQQITDLIKDMSNGMNPGKVLVLDTTTGKLVSTLPSESPANGQIIVSPDEGTMYCLSHTTLVLLHDELDSIVRRLSEVAQPIIESFCSFDNNDVIRLFDDGNIRGIILNNTDSITSYTETYDLVIQIDKDDVHAIYQKKSIGVMVTPASEEVFSRVKGIYETDILSEKKVLLIGLGSGNSPTALELVKQGVRQFVLVDFDKLELSNISRHVCGLNDIGRYKTKAVADLLKNKNPYVNVTTYEVDITETTYEFRNKLVEDIDLVICGTDNRKSRLLVNRLCVEHNIPCIYGGAFRRAYGGQVLHVIPHQTMCYQCFIQQLPEIATDYEISNQHQINEIAYSDRNDIPIEPGLSTDIAPISTMVSKLAILDLLKGKQHSLQDLYEDLTPALYIWFNRREPGSQWYDELKPITYYDKMTILRWYGIKTERLSNCPVCGTFNPDLE